MEKQGYGDIYYQMVIIRKLEEKAATLYQKGKIGGFLHLYIGQEAVSTGLISARQENDRVITAYRDHGVAINCGIPSKVVMAELLGKSTGCSRGRGGSMHMADVTKNFFGGHAIVGAHLPVAMGLGLGDFYQGNDSVTICMFGDGATNIGYFHEALNLAKVWNLPLFWVCENNKYGMGTEVSRASAVSEIRQKANGYGMKSEQVDGMDVLKVRETASRMIGEIRAGSGPQLLEAITYRYRGHSMGDPERYRDQKEIEKWEKNDPIGLFRTYLITENIFNKTELDDLDDAVDKEIDEAVQFAESSPNPSPDELFENVYAEEPWEAK